MVRFAGGCVWGEHVPASRHSCRTVGMDVRRSASDPQEPLGASRHRACKVRHRTRALFERHMELTEQATFAVGSDAGNGALSIRLSGAWTLRRGLPSAKRIEHEI